ncbi:MAG TPA: 50S ribosomal protein L11 methyltransferase [Thermoanaerobaculia bacterium]|jgi:ribosomal protein L11 methyltransferase
MRATYSRLTVPKKSGDDATIGLLFRFDPLGFAEEDRDLVAFFREADRAREAGRALAACRIRHSISTEIPEADPFVAYRALSRPIVVGSRFWLDPGDPSDATPPAGRIALRLPASRAFGTGGHESTRLALAALEDEVEPGTRVLDAGTGSGVLALAAAALGAAVAVGFDVDVEAVCVARENLARHEFGSRVRLVAGGATALRGSFDVVVANMLPEELEPLIPELKARLSPRGRLIVSGIPASAEKQTSRRLRSRRLTLSGRRAENDWVSLTFARG